MVNYLIGLNEQQRQAVETTDGYVRVIAGAGTGKTRALTTRYVHLVKNKSVSPENILCVTFTNKAANEMRARIRKMTGENNDAGFICTFHSFCMTFLKEEITFLNYPKNFIVLDEEDITSIFRKIYKENNIKKNEYPFKKAKDYIDEYKRRTEAVPGIELTSEELRKAYASTEDIYDKILFGYLYEQRKIYGLDFNDLIIFTLHILENNKKICLKWQKKIKYLMVDEFQDVSKRQFRLAKILSDYNKNLFIVGDPDQTIYTFRGASVKYILDFPTIFEDSKTIILDLNYRSNQKILNASNELISYNNNRVKKDLYTTRKDGELPVYYHAKSYNQECDWIAEQVKTISEIEDNLDEIAILYRGSYISRGVEEALMNRNIPYVIYSGISFYSRKEIKDLISYLRMIAYEDDISFRRIINVPKRGFGPKRLEYLEQYSLENNISLYQSLKDNIDNKEFNKKELKDFIDLIEDSKKSKDKITILDLLEKINVRIGYEDDLKKNEEEERLENVEELKDAIKYFENSQEDDGTLDNYLARITLYTNMDKNEAKNTVKLMTVHAAKGLEFKYVFVCGMSEGQFPSRKSSNEEDIEEERRLAYVACTRAKDNLYITDSEGYSFVSEEFKQTSRFVYELGKNNLFYIISKEEEEKENGLDDEKPTEMTFSVGDKVKSPKYGIGVILMANYRTKKYAIKFDKVYRNLIVKYDEELDIFNEPTEEDIKSDFESLIKEKQDEIDKKNRLIEEFEENIKKLQNENMEKNVAEINNLEVQIESLKDEVNKKEMIIKECYSEIELLKKENLNINELQEKIKEYTEIVSTKDKKIEEMTNKIDSLNKELTSSRTINSMTVVNKKETLLNKIINYFK